MLPFHMSQEGGFETRMLLRGDLRPGVFAEHDGSLTSCLGTKMEMAKSRTTIIGSIIW